MAQYMTPFHLRFRTFILGFIGIAEGVATILCLGRSPGWECDFIFWDTQRWCKKQIEKEKRDGQDLSR